MCNVGIKAGNALLELGQRKYVYHFFLKIANLANETGNGPYWSIITDRLFKRYVSYSDLNLAKQVFAKIELDLISNDPVVNNALIDGVSWKMRPHWDGLEREIALTISQGFDLALGYGSALVDLKGYVMPTVRIVRTDQPALTADLGLTNDDYDLLSDDAVPLWAA